MNRPIKTFHCVQKTDGRFFSITYGGLGMKYLMNFMNMSSDAGIEALGRGEKLLQKVFICTKIVFGDKWKNNSTL